MFYRFSLYGFLKNLRFFGPFIILIFTDNGLSYFQIGLLYSIRDIATNILEIPTGVYADTFGRRRSMVMAFLAYIMAFIIFYAFGDFYIYALAMLFFAAGEAFRSGTHKAIILEYLQINNMQHLKVAYYGLTRSASQFGSAINSLIAAGLVFYSGGYKYMFIASTIPYVLDLLNLATYPKELDGELKKLQKGDIWEQIKITLKAFGGVFKNWQAMQAILSSSSFSAVFKTTKDYLQPILAVFALSLPLFVSLEGTKREAVVIGVVYFGIYLLTSYASRRAGDFSKRFAGAAQAVNVTFLLGAGFLFLAGMTTWLNVTIISVIVFLGFYVLQNIRKPITVGLISDQISHEVMASGLSVESQFTTLLVAVLSPLMGALADSLGVGVALAILGGGMLLVFGLVRIKGKREE
ncbi:MAG: MFS transporter [Anaerolineaceae bacterium 4572_5.1]|nr:MAG: MFS transporter [Anaerolineaceae bacterium 4572_5.1]